MIFAVATAFAPNARTARAEPEADPAEVDTIRIAANRALAEGRFASAHSLYRSILARDPEDPSALREGGRAAHASGDFAGAARLLAAAAARITTPDPELHYLLAEALWALGRKSEAHAEYSVVRREIGSAPVDRLPRLWLARIHDRSGDRAAACAIYDAMSSAAPGDAEVALTHAEMHASAREWSRAAEPLRRFLRVHRGHKRALEMLAWIAEARGDLTSELELREALARDSTTAAPVRDYGRALERSGDWAAALAAYRRAEGLAGGAQDAGLGRALHRMERRMSIEIAGGAVARSDVGAAALGGFAGVAVPFGRAHHLAFGAWRDLVSSGARDGSSGDLSAAVALNSTASSGIAGLELGIIDFTSGRGDGTWSRTSTEPAAFASVRRSLFDRHVELGLDGEWNTVWRETPLVELEGGRVDALTAHVWANGFSHRLVIDTGAQVRRLDFLPEGTGDPSASLLLAWAGADWQLWIDPSRQAAGEILDDDLLRPTFLASALVASYRHHEAFGTASSAFMERLVVAERVSLDELSFTARIAMREGRLAFDTHGGLGYDHARALWIASGKASLWLATGDSSRLVWKLDFATEGDLANSGNRLAGGMAYHVDL